MAYQPFYIVNAQNQEENWEALEEKDWDYIKGMYPQMAKEIQDKVEEECDKLEYEGSMMFDEYPDKLMMRNICERIYKKIQDEKEREKFYAEDDGEMTEETENYPVNNNSSVPVPMEYRDAAYMSAEGISANNMTMEHIPAEQVCTSCQRRSLQSLGWNSPQGGSGFPSPRPPQGGPGFPPPRPPQGGPGFPPPRPPQGGPGFPPPRPPQGGPGFFPPRPPQGEPGFPPPRPPQGGPGFFPPRPPQGGPGFPPPRPPKRPCSCPPGRPCRDCLVALQNQPDWTRDMIEVLLYQEMLRRRSRRRRRRQYQRNYGLTE